MNATERTTGNAHGHCITVGPMLLEADNSEGPSIPDSTVQNVPHCIAYGE